MAAAASGIALAAGARVWPGLARVAPVVPIVLAPVALAALFVVPLGIRELPSANFQQHEGFHAGWVSSIFFGKWMLADANLIYGLLREYILAAWLRLAGINLLQLRVAHVLLNLASVALVSVISWQLCRRRLWLHLACIYMTVFHTPLNK